MSTLTGAPAAGGPVLAARDLLATTREYLDAGAPDRAADLIATRGDEMLAAGGAADLLALGAALPADARTPDVRLILADAARMAGDVAGAQRAFAPLLVDAHRTGRWSAGLAWRAAMLHYLRADHRGALDLLDKVPVPAGDPGADDVFAAAVRATVLVVLGEPDRAAVAAARALAAAAAHGDRALAAAHLAAAFTTNGARRDAHLADALSAAERAGDVIVTTRILANQADGMLRAARYPQALNLATRAVRAAEAGAPPGMLVTALHNAGEALARLGRYDEAIVHFERSMRVCRRVGLARAAAGLYGLAEVNHQLGRREQSRTAYEESVELARETGEVQILVPALAGLARLLAHGSGQPAEPRAAGAPAARTPAADADGTPAGTPAADADVAEAHAIEAVALAPPALAPRALAARGWVALAAGDLRTARECAAEAVHAARAGRQADLLAGALELSAAVNPQPAAARAALREAAAIWHRAGAVAAADRTSVLLGRLAGSDGAQRLAARAATKRLLALGVRVVGGCDLVPADAAAVRVGILGRFEVCVGGAPVPLPAWRSRQARTLLKILVARRGRPVPRTELCELLWPDDDPQRTAHRLSVLLSAVRTVLDPDRRWPADHYVRADPSGLSVDHGRVGVDAEDLLRDAAHGVQLASSGDHERAREVLTDVDAAYTGDAFDADPYEDWADGLREQVRAGWLRAVRALAILARAAGDLDQAATCLVRLLGADPYDESAHRALVEVLVRAGRHGEARRAFDRWGRAMRTIDAPAPGRDALAVRTLGQQAYGPAVKGA